MKAVRHFAKFAGGVTAAACLLGFPNLTGDASLPRQITLLEVEESAPSGSRGWSGLFPIARREAGRRESLGVSINRGARAARTARARAPLLAVAIAGSKGPSPASTTVSQACPPPPPAHDPSPTTLTLTPLGYVRKPDGTVEAVLGEGEQVQVLHEGEIFADKYKVLKISPSSVEVVEVPAAGNGLPHEVRRTRQAIQVAEAQEGSAGRQALQSTKGSTKTPLPPRGELPPPLSQPLGYVEKENGEVVAVIADGESIQLVTREPIMAGNSKASQQLSAARANPRALDRLQANSQGDVLPRQVLALNALPDTPTFVAAQVRSDIFRRVSGLVSPRVARPEPNAYVPASLIAHLNGPGAVIVPKLINSSPPVRNASDQTTRIDTKPVMLTAIGYVQRPNGQVEAILDHNDEVYVVHEGEVFADKFKALRVSPFAVIAEDLSPQPPESPGTPELAAMADEQPSLGTANGSQRPPDRLVKGLVASLREGRMRGTDLPAHREDAKQSRLAKRAPPKGLRGSVARGSPEPLTRVTASNPVRSAPPTPAVQLWKPLGYVQKPNGEYEAVVANGDSVYLVHKGEVFAERFKVIDMSASVVEVVEVSPDQLIPQVDQESNWARTEQRGPLQNCIITRYPSLDGTEMAQESPRMMGGGGCMPQRSTELLDERRLGKRGLNLSSPMPDNGAAPR